MITLEGAYTNEHEGNLQYICRAILYRDTFYNPVNQVLDIKDGDVLMMLGKGTWYALYSKRHINDIVVTPKCDHDFYDIHPSFGDPSMPTGKRCSKCNHQIFY